jgi:hypothetical protein
MQLLRRMQAWNLLSLLQHPQVFGELSQQLRLWSSPLLLQLTGPSTPSRLVPRRRKELHLQVLQRQVLLRNRLV